MDVQSKVTSFICQAFPEVKTQENLRIENKMTSVRLNVLDVIIIIVL